MSGAIVGQQKRQLLNQFLSQAIGRKDIHVTIIIIIEHGRSPGPFARKGRIHPAAAGYILKAAMAGIAVEGTIAQIDYQQIGPAVAVDITD